MKVLHRIEELATVPEPLHLAIGVFDGLHLGHQAVLRQAVLGSRDSEGLPMMVTFDPHPLRILRPDQAPHILTHTAHKLRLAETYGIHRTLLIPFDEEFASHSGRDFIVRLAENAPDLRQICVGKGWRFGRDRSGDVKLLKKLGKEFGFKAEGVPTVLLEDESISSTNIRRLIQEGDFPAAAHLLGRDYTVLGTVVEGEKLGRTIGFPTANLAVHNEQLPPSGVYVISADLGGPTYNGVGNLGLRPTVTEGETQRRLEIHLFDYDGPELYGRDLEVRFLEHLRPEQKFDNLDALKAQILKDVAQARRILLR